MQKTPLIKIAILAAVFFAAVGVSSYFFPSIIPPFDTNIAQERFPVKNPEDVKNLDDSKDQFEIARRYQIGEGYPVNIEKRIYWLKKSAAQGLPKAQAALGEHYLFGDGIKKDPAEGMRLFNLALEKNDPFAQVSMCMIYQGEPNGPPADVEKALGFCKQAADQLDPDGMYFLAHMYFKPGPHQKVDQGVYLMRKLAGLHFEPAVAEIAGNKAACHDTNEKIESAAQAFSCMMAYYYGDMEGAFVTGNILDEGRFIKQDTMRARAAWIKAAEMGDTRAPMRVVMTLVDANDQPWDPSWAYIWLNIAQERSPEYAARIALLKERAIAKLTPEDIQRTARQIQEIESTITANTTN